MNQNQQHPQQPLQQPLQQRIGEDGLPIGGPPRLVRDPHAIRYPPVMHLVHHPDHQYNPQNLRERIGDMLARHQQEWNRFVEELRQRQRQRPDPNNPNRHGGKKKRKTARKGKKTNKKGKRKTHRNRK
jgi:hypothetical protein